MDDLCSTMSEMAQNQNMYEFLRQHRQTAIEEAGQEFNPHKKKDRRQGLRSKEAPAPTRKRKAGTSAPVQPTTQQNGEVKTCLSLIPYSFSCFTDEISKLNDMVSSLKLQSWSSVYRVPCFCCPLNSYFNAVYLPRRVIIFASRELLTPMS